MTDKLRQSVMKRQKFFKSTEQLNVLRFLTSLDAQILREKEWTDFAKRFVSRMPTLTVMEMDLSEI